MSVRIESSAEPILGYRLIDRLGSGGFGEVWRAEAPGGIYKAIKIIHGDLRNRDTDAYRFAEQELKAMKRVKQVRHPYLLAIDRYDIVEGRLFIVMELADCNLWDRFRVCRKEGLPGIPREELLQYMSECAEVLDLFNDKFQLQHLDIKPQNLFLLYDHVKVADFGQVKDLQNHMAEVTGGITPVYAAPETFDGFVSRYCDQYSLACVYQELLTGIRPFDGNSMQQLLMQHLQMPPNLSPSPPGDRPALYKSLSKKPDDRFPSVKAMVEALRSGGRIGVNVNTPATFGTPSTATQTHSDNESVHGMGFDDSIENSSASARIEVQLPLESLNQTSYPEGNQAYAGMAPTNHLGLTGFLPQAQFIPQLSEDATAPLTRAAPPIELGEGSLRPTMVIGLGEVGRRVVKRFRQSTSDQFGTPDKLPAIRTLYIDSDPDSLAAAENDLAAEDIFPIRLNRAAHYLKPKTNGRTILDGWFDPQWLYKLPRNPVTMGLRCFGRLAFCDHYRTLSYKLFAECEAATAADALAITQESTGLDKATNQPVVYIVTGLGGGTGSGAYLDLAYAVRGQLRRLGYQNPEIVALCFIPPDHPDAVVSNECRANTYAALTELHHYTRPDTAFQAWYDEHFASIREMDAPFSQVFLLNGPNQPLVAPSSSSLGSAAVGLSTRTPATTTKRPSGTTRALNNQRPSNGVKNDVHRRVTSADGSDPYSVAADFIRVSIFTQAGPLLNEVRPKATNTDLGTFLNTVGLTRFSWPRAALIRRTGRLLAGVLVQHWVSPDPTHVRELIPNWAVEQWQTMSLEPARLGADILRIAEAQAGVNLQQLIELGSDQLVPKGWLARTPEPEKVGTVLESWVALIGRPNSPIGRDAVMTEAVADASNKIIERLRTEFGSVFPQLIESAQFRLAGTEEAIRQIISILDRNRTMQEKVLQEREAESTTAIDQLQGHAYHHLGMRKLTNQEFTAAVRAFPRAQTAHLTTRAVLRVYRKIKDVLIALLAEVSSCRARIEQGLPEFSTDAETIAATAATGEYLPAGCATTEDAVQLYIKSLTDDDLIHLDHHVQEGLLAKFGGLYQACLNSGEGHVAIFAVVREQTRSYLEARLGAVDLAGILFHHFQGKRHAASHFQKAFDEAGPRIVGNGPWTHHALNVYIGPNGPGGDPLRDIAAEILPEGTIDVIAPDEVIICREFPEVPLAALPQFGPQWANAYNAFSEHQQITPHSRLDITRWTDIDTV